MEGCFRYWGKAEREGGGYHLLPYHSLDVAAVAAVWWDSSPAIRRGLQLNTDVPEAQLRAWVLFFVAMHDCGKFDVRFQQRMMPLWRLLYPDANIYAPLPSFQQCKDYKHGDGGLYWFQQDRLACLNDTEPNKGFNWDSIDCVSSSDGSLESWLPWIQAVAGHHGHIRTTFVPDASLPIGCDRRFAQIDRSARDAWRSCLESLFLQPVGLSLSDSPPPCSQIFLAGFCSVADWLGSRCDDEHFRFCREPMDLRTYFKERFSHDAPSILKLAGVIGHPHAYSGVVTLLGKGDTPRSLQTLVDALPLQAGLTLVEAPTGSGKTEAAMAYAWRLVAAGLADSIVFALPTQATANAMLGRLQRIAPLLFADNPNLLLAHGMARFNDTFTAIKHVAIDGYDPEEDGWVQCSQWLAESRKRVFLGQMGVCTVDQVLISALPVKHRFVRGFGVGRSVLIVDEVHAYDAYMYGLLEAVLRQQKEAGGAAILLSATLPEQQRQQLCDAWGVALEKQGEATPYPLITKAGDSGIVPYELDPSERPVTRRVKVEAVRVDAMVPDDALLGRIVAAAEAGAQVAVVCNLVDIAQGLARTLRTMTALPVDLFHARYCFAHRQRKEKRVIMRFGLKGKRRRGRILVATQVAEQSLDVDFDWLITQLCPVDLLFQRMGRLHRHERNDRPSGFELPVCTVLLPTDDDFGLHGHIYANTRALWRTQELLVSTPNCEVVFPAAYRDWIESVYQDDAWVNEPTEIRRQFDEYEIKHSVSRYKALQMISMAITPLPDSDENVTAVTRDGEMNLTVVPFCTTPQGRMLMDGTLFETLDEYRRPECLSLNSVGVPQSWRRALGNSDEGRFWLEMGREGEGYGGISNGTTFRYHKDLGLEKEK
ncbi:MAG: CRISPR-associated helicase/endonuclease Cas3 [Geobacter sp.]|nr:CRISPR-associated helicase/endonuclease Cas3 [Geobacter sp.]